MRRGILSNRLCECGCGQYVTVNTKFRRGHHNRTLDYRMKMSKERYKGGRTPIGGYIALRKPLHKKRTYEHVAIAERLLGYPLPPKAEVHHFNEDRTDNRSCNLVICPSHAYHCLLHQRTRAYDACGHADWRKCWICQEWDAPENIKICNNGSTQHRACRKNYDFNRRSKGRIRLNRPTPMEPFSEGFAFFAWMHLWHHQHSDKTVNVRYASQKDIVTATKEGVEIETANSEEKSPSTAQ